MSVILYQKKDFKGAADQITGDVRSLKDLSVGAHPSSLELTDPDDVVLLFQRQDWKGDCIWRRGKLSIRNLGSKDAGGKLGFGNTVASVRISPFVIKLNVTVVTTAKGKAVILPGGFVDPAKQVSDIVDLANDRLTALKTLLTLQVGDVVQRESDRKFDVDAPKIAAYPLAWKKVGQLDVVVANTALRSTAAGVTKPPCLGQVMLLAARVEFTNPNTGQPGTVNFAADMMAAALLHELGHYLGVHHPSAKGEPANIMGPLTTNSFTGSLSSPQFGDLEFSAVQIENMQNALAHNPARRLDRRGD